MGGKPDRADLDHNWRASAPGPASDRSSNSGGERDRDMAVSRKMTNSTESRADLDQNWRNHETPEILNSINNTLPPSGAKGKFKNKGQKSGDKGAMSENSTRQKNMKKPEQSKENKMFNDKLENDRLKHGTEKQAKDESEKESNVKGKPDVSRTMDNSKHIKDNNNKSDYQLVESENGAVKRKKKKKKKGDRSNCLGTAKNVDTANNEYLSKCDKNESISVNSSAKPNAGNRFSRIAGPRIPKR